MLMIWLKKKEEFQKVCQGRTVFYAVEEGSIHYFTLAKANEIEVLYAFDSESPIPFRENYDFEDADGIHVWQLIEIDNLYSLENVRSLGMPDDIVQPELV